MTTKKPKKGKKEREELSEELDAGLRVKFVPECGRKYTTNVYNRLLVKDCDNITAKEKREMSDELIRKGEASANAICGLNKECPNARLVSYKFIRIVCEDRLWEVDLRWTFVCGK